MRARYSAPPDLTDSAATRPALRPIRPRSRGGGGGPRRPTSLLELMKFQYIAYSYSR